MWDDTEIIDEVNGSPISCWYRIPAAFSWIKVGYLYYCPHWSTDSHTQKVLVLQPYAYPFSKEEEDLQYQVYPSVKITRSTEYKNIQTTLSYTNVPIEKHNDNFEIRKTKSHEDIKKCNQTQEEIMEWLQEIYNVHKAKVWNGKFQRIAERLKKPGGEQKLKAKIRKFLHRVPSHFSDEDEEGKEFREKLPDYLIKKLKKVLLKSEKHKAKRVAEHNNETVETTNEEIRTEESELKSIIRIWLNKLPINKKILHKKHISTDDVIDSIARRIEPFIIYRPQSDRDYECMFKSYVFEILNELPFQDDFNEDNYFLRLVSDDLFNSIMKLYTYVKDVSIQFNFDELNNKLCSSPPHEQSDIKELENFVCDEVIQLLDDYDLVIDKNRMTCVQMELVGIFLEELRSPGVYTNGEMTSDVIDVLQEIGRLTVDQAELFSEKLIDDFKQKFDYKIKKKVLRNALSETYLVYYYPNTRLNEPKQRLSEKYDDQNLNAFSTQISRVIEHWLNGFKKAVPMLQYRTFLEMAVTELSNIIVNRYKYLELHPFSKGSVTDESEHLKFLIFKWVRTLVGEDKIEIIQQVPKLLTNIQKVTVPSLRTKLSLNTSELPTESNRKADARVIKELYDEIFDWYFDLPLEFHDYEAKKQKKQYIRKLAESIEKNVDTDENLDEVIQKEVNAWAEILFNRLLRRSLIGELKIRIRNAYLESKHYTADASLQAKATTYNIGIKTDSFTTDNNFIDDSNCLKRRVIKQIEEWLTNLPNIPMYDKASKQTAVKNLASDIIDRQRYLKLNPTCWESDEEELENLKYQIFKWLNTILSEDNFVTVEHAPELMEMLREIMPTERKRWRLPTEDTYEGIGYTNSRHNSLRKKLTDSYDTALSAPTLNSQGIGNCNKGFRGCHGVINNLLGDVLNAEGRSQSASCNTYTDTQREPLRNTWSNPMPFEIRATMAHHRLRTSNTKDACLSINGGNFEVYRVHKTKKTKERNEPPVPHGMNLTETYEYFDQIFQTRCNEVPVDESTLEQKELGDIGRRTIYNGIWKTYFRLKSDPSIENDYTLFQSMFDDHLDLMLDCLPQTKQMIDFRDGWKAKIIQSVMKMLEYVHCITDSTSFKQMLTDKFERHFLRSYSQPKPDVVQHILVANAIDAYILYARYKNDDPTKANIYRQRIMRRLDELADRIKNSQNQEFRNLNRNQICQEAFRVLGTVALPDIEILKAEADEVLLAEEIEQWYDELPAKRIKSELDNLIRKRTRQILAKKLHDVERRHHLNEDEIQEEVLPEIIKFLAVDAQLEDSPVININFLAQELANRLKNRRQVDAVRRRSVLIAEPYSKAAALAPLVASQGYLPNNFYTHQAAVFNEQAINTDNLQNYYDPNELNSAYLADQIATSNSRFVEPIHVEPTQNVPQLADDAQVFATGVPVTNNQKINQRVGGGLYPIFASTGAQANPEKGYHDNFTGSGRPRGQDSAANNDLRAQANPENGYNDNFTGSGRPRGQDSAANNDARDSAPSDDDEIRVRCNCTERFYKCLKKKKLYNNFYPCPYGGAFV